MPELQHDLSTWQSPKWKYIGLGLLSALQYTLFDWLLPYWIRAMYMIGDHLQRAGELDLFLKIRPYPPWVRLIQFSAFISTTGCLNIFWVPRHRSLLCHGLMGSAVVVVVSTLEYGRSNGSPGNRRLDMLARRYIAVSHVFVAFVVVQRRWICSILPKLCLLTICLCTGLSMLRWCFGPAIPPTGRPFLEDLIWQAGGEHKRITTQIGKVQDIFDIIKAVVMGRLPTMLQMEWSRLQQYRRARGPPTYQYSSLEPSQIRLLRVERASWWRPSSIKTSLLHVNPHSSPEYEAVSYTWGDDRRTQEILIDGARFAVTKSAYSLLLAQRSIWRVRTIWIDAICINQANDVEKAEQIQKMRDIYHSATRVVVYVTQDWKARLASSLLYHTVTTTQDSQEGYLALMQMISGEKAALKWHALRELLTNDYWNRTWVVQEIASGQNVQLYYGGLYIDLATFAHFARQVIDPYGSTATMGAQGGLFLGSPTLANFVTMMSLRPDFSRGNDHITRTSLEAVLFATSRHSATNARDKVFGVLGLAWFDKDSDLLQVEYGDAKSTTDVLQEAVEYVLLNPTRQSVHLLALAGVGFAAGPALVPSWVLDPSEARLCHSLTDPIGETEVFQASRSSRSDLCRGPLPRSISVSGVACDAIHTICPVANHDFGVGSGTISETLVYGRKKAALLESCIEFSEYVKTIWPEESCVHYRDCLWLVMVAGRIAGRRPTDCEKWGNVFHAWHQIMQIGATVTTEQSMGDVVDNNQGVVDSNIRPEDLAVYDATYGRCLAVTIEGRFCWVPPLAQVGDEVHILDGAQTPYVIRPVPSRSEDAYQLVGEAYVDGLMEGEIGESSNFAAERKIVTLV